jgi:hypothetical protein
MTVLFQITEQEERLAREGKIWFVVNLNEDGTLDVEKQLSDEYEDELSGDR